MLMYVIYVIIRVIVCN